MTKKSKWFRLDNAAKIFPPTSNARDCKVFRFSCELEENVKPEILSRALEKNLELFPGFNSVLKKGLFWYYLETSSLIHIIKEEKLPLCSPIYNKNKKSLLFRVTYYKCRINLEVYHALTDGTGALEFLKSLVSLYLVYSHKDKFDNKSVVLDYDASNTERMEDSFNKYYRKQKNSMPLSFERNYQIKGEKLKDNRMRVVEGHISVKQLINIAHKYNATLTSFVAAVYLMAISKTMSIEDKKRPVSLTLPVNLRKYFKSATARNFFGVVPITYKFSDNDISFNQLVSSVNDIFKKELTQENIEKRMNSLSALEHNFIVRLIPLFIKDIVLKLADKIEQMKISAALSNIGKVEMPEIYKNYIKRFDVFVSTAKQQICMCSYNDELTISFSSAFVSTDIIKYFFRILTSLDVKVEIDANVLDE